MKNVGCDCDKWGKNTLILNSVIQIQSAMSWGNPKGHTGDRFDFCPWCGKKLIECTARA